MKARVNFPNGEVQSPEDIPPPPKELADFQRQKDNVILHFRDMLRDALGVDKFNKFNEFARQKIAPEVTTIPVRQGDK